MNISNKFKNEESLQSISYFLMILCYLAIAFFISMVILSLMGRHTYHLHSHNSDYPNAIYAENNHEYSSRSLTVSINDNNIRVYSISDTGKIELITYIGIVLTSVLTIIPMIFAFWFLAKLFSNVSRGNIFIQDNANYLLYYGIIHILLGVVIPLIKCLVISITDMISTDSISIHTGSQTPNLLITGITFIVASYIINCGINLQDEVDHTL